MRKTKKALATVAIAGMVTTMVPLQVLADTQAATKDRIYGPDRYATAVAIAQKGWTKADVAILSAGLDANLVDALSAAPLAAAKNAPILLTDGTSLSDGTKAELALLGVKTVYVTSGSGVIKQPVIDALKAMNIEVKTLGGVDRFETAANIAKEIGPKSSVVVTTAYSNADALSVAAIAAAQGMPILLADPANGLSASEADYVKNGVTKSYVLGGPTLVSEATKNALPNATRIYGQDRFDTNLEVLKAFDGVVKYDKVYIANGTDAHLVDALAGAPLAAKDNAAIALGDVTLKSANADYIKAKAPGAAIALGGSAVVSDAALSSVLEGDTQQPTTPAQNVSISNLKIQGQTTGTGAVNAPAIAKVNDAITVSADVNGAGSNLTVQYLVSTSDNITAKDANGNVLVASKLTAPIVIGNDTFDAAYTVPVASDGTVSASFTSTASSNEPFNVVIQAPFTNNGAQIRSDEVRMQWGVAGTMVLSPMYNSASSPDNLNYSTNGDGKGLVAVVATILPAEGDTSSVAGKTVKFTLQKTGASVDNASTVYFTDAQGKNMVDANAFVGSGQTSSYVTYTTTTDEKGQAIAYINANTPTKNNVPLVGAWIEASVRAEIVNGGSSTGTSYYKWQTYAYPTQISNVSPSEALNDASSDNGKDANSGERVTFSGTLQDAAGNPVPNARIVVTDYDVTVGSNNLDSDSYIDSNGNAVMFDGTHYLVTTSDANGQFSFTVTATIPATQKTSDSINKYYVYYAPATVALADGQSLPKDGSLKLLSVNGSNNDYLSVRWHQGETVQAVGVGTSALPSSYDALANVPQSINFTKLVGDARELFAAAYNQNGQIIAPAQNNQFAGYKLDYTITAPSGMNITTFEYQDVSTLTGVPNVSEIYYTVNDGPGLTITRVIGTDATGAQVDKTVNISVSTYDGSGMVEFKVNSDASSKDNGTSGSVQVAVNAYQGTKAQGGASASINGTFSKTSDFTAIGAAGTLAGIYNFQPLVNENAAPSNTLTVTGQAYGGSGSSTDHSKQAEFLFAPFNDYVSLATIPTQGINYTITGDKNVKIERIDGYQLTGEPITASVRLQSNGVVSVNNVNLWSEISGSTIVAYYVSYDTTGGSAATATTYVLSQKGTNFTLNKVNADHTIGDTIGTWTFTSVPPAPHATLAYEITSDGHLVLRGDVDYRTTTSTNTVTGASAMVMAPVQVITVRAADKYTESPVFTISNSLNDKTAKVTADFTSASSGLVAITSNPASISGVQNGTQVVTITAQDFNGNPLANQTMYFDTNLTGLWITQVNGTNITTTVNMGTSTSVNNQTVNTPVPLFNKTDLATKAISVNGLTAYRDTNGKWVVAVQTGVDGTVSLTLADGNVTYVATNSTTGGGEFVVDPGQAISGELNVKNGSGVSVGTIPVTWAGPTAPSGGSGSQPSPLVTSITATYDGLASTHIQASVDASVVKVEVYDDQNTLLATLTPQSGAISGDILGTSAGKVLTVKAYKAGSTTADYTTTVTVQ